MHGYASLTSVPLLVFPETDDLESGIAWDRPLGAFPESILLTPLGTSSQEVRSNPIFSGLKQHPESGPLTPF